METKPRDVWNRRVGKSSTYVSDTVCTEDEKVPGLLMEDYILLGSDSILEAQAKLRGLPGGGGTFSDLITASFSELGGSCIRTADLHAVSGPRLSVASVLGSSTRRGVRRLLEGRGQILSSSVPPTVPTRSAHSPDGARANDCVWPARKV